MSWPGTSASPPFGGDHTHAGEITDVDLDNLPSHTLRCGRCGGARPWTDYTLTALNRANGDGDSLLKCSDCRRAKAYRRTPISRQAKNKRECLRRAELKAAELQALISRETAAGVWSAGLHSPTELARQLAETQRAIVRHLADLPAMHDARAHGEIERIAINRRTADHGRPSIQSPTERFHP